MRRFFFSFTLARSSASAALVAVACFGLLGTSIGSRRIWRGGATMNAAMEAASNLQLRHLRSIRWSLPLTIRPPAGSGAGNDLAHVDAAIQGRSGAANPARKMCNWRSESSEMRKSTETILVSTVYLLPRNRSAMWPGGLTCTIDGQPSGAMPRTGGSPTRANEGRFWNPSEAQTAWSRPDPFLPRFCRRSCGAP